MISYEVPLARYPDTYNGKPLIYAALASQKNNMAVYLMSIYMTEESHKKFEAEYKMTGKRRFAHVIPREELEAKA